LGWDSAHAPATRRVGGGGYGLWNQENTAFIDGPPRVPFTATTTAGGRGYLGTVGGGCDYQFPVGGWNFVVGAFADYDWSSIKGKLNPPAAIGLVAGLFWKTEYRFSEFDVETNPVRFTTGAPSGVSDDSKKWVHTIRSELVYRFNWGGPIAGRY
jgi:hypothetical protein